MSPSGKTYETHPCTAVPQGGKSITIACQEEKVQTTSGYHRRRCFASFASTKIVLEYICTPPLLLPLIYIFFSCVTTGVHSVVMNEVWRRFRFRRDDCKDAALQVVCRAVVGGSAETVVTLRIQQSGTGCCDKRGHRRRNTRTHTHRGRALCRFNSITGV